MKINDIYFSGTVFFTISSIAVASYDRFESYSILISVILALVSAILFKMGLNGVITFYNEKQDKKNEQNKELLNKLQKLDDIKFAINKTNEQINLNDRNLKAEINNLLIELSKITRDNNQQFLSVLESNFEKLNDNIAKLKKTNDELSINLKQVFTDMNKQLIAGVEESCNKINDIIEKSANDKKEYQAQLLGLVLSVKKNISKINEDIEEYKMNSQNMYDTISTLESSINGLKKSIDKNLRDMLNDLSDSIDNNNENIDKNTIALNEDLKLLKEEYRKLSEYNKQFVENALNQYSALTNEDMKILKRLAGGL